MNNNTKRQNRKDYIDGLKGILCLLIMLGHFWNINRVCTGASPFNLALLSFLNQSFLAKTLFVASFWLYAFLVISGYLLSKSKIRSTGDLGIGIASRFLRLFLPILGACCMIFLIQELVGFHASETSAYFTNTWFQKYYRTLLGWKDIFIQSGKAMYASACAFNTPFWVISDMFATSVLMYICSFTDHIYHKKTHLLPVIFTVVAILLDRHVMIACLVGYLLGYYEDAISKMTENAWNFLAISAAIFSFYLFAQRQNVLPGVFDKIGLYILWHSFFLIMLNRFHILQRVFSVKPCLLLGKISFGIYSFHWPVICSVGSLVLIRGLEGGWGVLRTYAASFVISLMCTVLLSVIYYFTVEKVSGHIVGWLKSQKRKK